MNKIIVLFVMAILALAILPHALAEDDEHEGHHSAATTSTEASSASSSGTGANIESDHGTSLDESAQTAGSNEAEDSWDMSHDFKQPAVNNPTTATVPAPAQTTSAQQPAQSQTSTVQPQASTGVQAASQAPASPSQQSADQASTGQSAVQQAVAPSSDNLPASTMVYIKRTPRQISAPQQQVITTVEELPDNQSVVLPKVNYSKYLDDDHDGVLNKDDKYPGQDDRLIVDSDGDGVVDFYDQYPGQNDTEMMKLSTDPAKNPEGIMDNQSIFVRFLSWLRIFG